MKRVMLAVVVGVIWVLSTLGQGVTVADVCSRFGLPAVGEGYGSGHLWTYTQAAGRRLLALPADDSFWIGYDKGGWSADYWDATMTTLVLWMYHQDGSERLLTAYHNRARPETVYVFVFTDTRRAADGGTHPCAAIRVRRDVFEAMIANLERIP